MQFVETALVLLFDEYAQHFLFVFVFLVVSVL